MKLKASHLPMLLSNVLPKRSSGWFVIRTAGGLVSSVFGIGHYASFRLSSFTT